MARHVKAMKKRDKFLLALSCIFLIGILCLIAGISMGGTLFAFRLNQNINPKYTQNGTFTLSEKDSGLITGIDFDFHCQDITIQRGDTCSIQPDDDTDSLESKYYSYVKDNVWHIETPNSSNATITFLDHTVRIPFLSKNWDSDVSYTITLPLEKHFDRANISIAAGDCEIDDALTADNTTLKVGAGSLDMTGLTAKQLSIKIGAGDGTIDKIHVSDHCTTKVGVGDLELGDTDNSPSENKINNLNSKTAVGNTDIAAKLTGTNQLECATGDLSLLLPGSKSNYNFTSHSSMGDICFGDSTKDDSSTDVYGDISLKCSLGDIDVDFERS